MGAGVAHSVSCSCRGALQAVTVTLTWCGFGAKRRRKKKQKTPIKAHPLFLRFMDQGCPRSMFQELRDYANAHRPERASRISEPYPSTSQRHHHQERWQSSGPWQSSTPPAEGWREERTWAPASRPWERGNSRTWSSNRAASSRDDPYEEL